MPLGKTRCTVWYAGRLLGTTALELPSFGPYSRAGFLAPSDAFAGIWTEIGPVFREARDVAHALWNDPEYAARTKSDSSVSKEELGRRVREALLAHPLSQRLTEAQARAMSLALEVRDADGQVIPCTHVVVQELTPPDFIPRAMFKQAIAEAAESGMEITWPCHVISVIDWPASFAAERTTSKT